MSDDILTVSCSCGKELKVRSSSAGKKVRCTDCGSIIAIPMASSGDPGPADPLAFLGGDTPAADTAGGTAAKPQIQIETEKDRSAKPSGVSKKAKPTSARAAGVDPSLAPKRVEPTPVDQLDRPVVAVDAGASSRQGKASSGGVGVGPTVTEAAGGAVAVRAAAENPFASPTSGASGSSMADRPAGYTPRKYPFLSLISSLYKVLGFITIGLAVIVPLGMVVIAVLSEAGIMLGILSSLPTLIGGLVGGVSMLAASELIKVAMDIQDNTHRSSCR